jgi:hypothetical protein
VVERDGSSIMFWGSGGGGEAVTHQVHCNVAKGLTGARQVANKRKRCWHFLAVCPPITFSSVFKLTATCHPHMRTSSPAFFISIILGSVESDLYWSVGATFIQIIDESAFIHPNVCIFIQNIAIPP